MNINWQKGLFFWSNECEAEILINSLRKQTSWTLMFSSKFLNTFSYCVTYSCNSAKLSPTTSGWTTPFSLCQEPCNDSLLWLLTNWLAGGQRLKYPLQGFASEVIIKTSSFDAFPSIAPSTYSQQSPSLRHPPCVTSSQVYKGRCTEGERKINESVELVFDLFLRIHVDLLLSDLV